MVGQLLAIGFSDSLGKWMVKIEEDKSQFFFLAFQVNIRPLAHKGNN